MFACFCIHLYGRFNYFFFYFLSKSCSKPKEKKTHFQRDCTFFKYEKNIYVKILIEPTPEFFLKLKIVKKKKFIRKFRVS